MLGDSSGEVLRPVAGGNDDIPLRFQPLDAVRAYHRIPMNEQNSHLVVKLGSKLVYINFQFVSDHL